MDLKRRKSRNTKLFSDILLFKKSTKEREYQEKQVEGDLTEDAAI
jgi:hypothetical protein